MSTSNIVTLTTDFGISDPYTGMMKGVILSINPKARLIDISHMVKAGSINHAADIIRDTFSFFPSGTIHIVVVDPGVGSKRRLIGIEAEGHFFIGPDNGIFWPVVNDFKGTKIIHLTDKKYFRPMPSPTFHGREIFAPVAAHLSLGVDLASMGQKINDPVKLESPAAYEKDGILYGQIVHVDHFGNLISNIYNAKLKGFLKSSGLTIEVGNLIIKKLDNIYSDVEKGELLAFINSSDLLEIAVHLSRASEYLETGPAEIIGTQVKIRKLL